MKILALEFSSPQRSVAVVQSGRVQGNCEVIETKTATQGTYIPAMVDEALRGVNLEREGIECLAVGLGPGSYTGVRGAIAVAQGWQLARAVKLLGISSVECIAQQAQATNLRGRVQVVLDAQRGEFYLAGYELQAEGCRETAPLRLASLTEVQAQESTGELLVGPEVTRWFPNGRILFPSAAVLGQLASTRSDFLPGEKLEPIYLRETSFVKAPPPRIRL